MCLSNRDLAENNTKNARPCAKSGIVSRMARQFRANAKGNVSLLFGLAAIPLFLAAGMAVDTARHGFHQQRLNTSVDAAALAVAKMEDGATQAEMEELARQYIDLNYTPRVDLHGNEIDLTVTLVGNVVTVTAEVDVPTTITTLIGVHDMTARANSEVTKEILGTEIALVLDNTGSMSGTKLTGLKLAADTLLDVMFDGVNSTSKIKIGIVPFAAAVNVGPGYKNSGWVDKTGAGTIPHINFTNAGWHSMKAWNKLDNKSWNGCVEARAMPYDIQDDAPVAGTPDTLFPPYLAPDQPDSSDSGVSGYGYYYPNSYLDDGVNSTNSNLDNRQRKKSKYVGAVVGGGSKGPSWNCETQPLTPLTNVETTLRDAIDDMEADGSTNITQGMAWGWHVLSPTAPFEESEPYTDKAWKKYMIVMTDGDNSWGNLNSHNGSFYTGYGHVAQGRLGVTDPDDGNDALNSRNSEICTNVKNATGDPSTAITVYTITFGSLSNATKDLMEACATDEDKYHHASTNAALKAVFEQIADEIGSIRLSQ